MENYIYTPNNSSLFRCRVPLENVSQLFVANGVIENTLEEDNFQIERNTGNLGYTINYRKGASEKNFIQIISVRNNTDALAYKNEIKLEENSHAKVLLCFHTLTQESVATNEELAISLKEGAILDLVVMQNEHNGSLHKSNFNITLNKDSYLNLHIITLHGGEISNNLDISLNGKGGDCRLNGLYLASGQQRISNCVNIYHNVGECHSNQLFKGILDGEAITNFSGKIYVEQDAQKSEAYQANNNLLASNSAVAYTQPHLEIYADDVKCSHGATIGSLNEDELFYMRSRGISMEEAKLLQQQAFANTVLKDINNEELRARLEELVEKRLRGEFSHCGNCSTHCC